MMPIAQMFSSRLMPTFDTTEVVEKIAIDRFKIDGDRGAQRTKMLAEEPPEDVRIIISTSDVD